jgi:NDP-sugar pyrophosphorylase family protein
VQATLGNSYGALRLLYSREVSPLGTGGALHLALPLLESETVLVMNGDSYCEANLADFWAWHTAQKADGSILLTEVDDTVRYGRVSMGLGGRIARFEEKGGSDGPGWISAGVYLLSRRFLLSIPPGRPVSLEREMFPVWVHQGLYGYRTGARFMDIGIPEAYANAAAFFAPPLRSGVGRGR